MLFREIKAFNRHNKDVTHSLFDESNGRYIKATWKDIHRAYECDVMEYDENEQEITTTALLTDADLANSIVRE